MPLLFLKEGLTGKGTIAVYGGDTGGGRLILDGSNAAFDAEYFYVRDADSTTYMLYTAITQIDASNSVVLTATEKAER